MEPYVYLMYFIFLTMNHERTLHPKRKNWDVYSTYPRFIKLSTRHEILKSVVMQNIMTISAKFCRYFILLQLDAWFFTSKSGIKPFRPWNLQDAAQDVLQSQFIRQLHIAHLPVRNDASPTPAKTTKSVLDSILTPQADFHLVQRSWYVSSH